MTLMRYTVAFFLFCMALTGCDKFVAPNAVLPTYSFVTPDAEGATWKPILLKTANEVSIAAPLAAHTTAFQAALTEVETATKQVTSEQQKAIDFWGTNGVVRWNEIARNFVAKYNLAPAADANGNYPVPSATAAATYPYFPFANPPYASRAYAYFSAAIYDAMVATWYYKYQYNVQAPYAQKSSIVPKLPASTLPSYPSEDAVMSGVAETLLAALFPLEAEAIKTKAAEQRQSRIWAGMNTPQDLEAGLTLGKAIAAKFVDRLKTDNMGKAIGSAQVYEQFSNQAQAKYGWAWKSLEVPARPGMLPLFGQVKMWVTPNLEAVRPAPPPTLNSETFKTAIEEVRRLQKSPSREQERIANFWSDGLSTYTPPGHWNRIASDLIVENKLSPIRAARTLAYMNMAIMDAGVSCWDTKYYYYLPRPSQVDPDIKTLLGVPNFPSYTSGHSTFSAAAATVLAYVFPQKATELNAMAKEASESRIYGGIHYRFDCEAGLEVGKKIGDYAIAFMRADKAEPVL